MDANMLVVVVIISYRTSHLMQALLDSIVEDDLDLKIYILDNASTPDTFRQLTTINDNRVKLLRSEKNLGFTGGINYTLKKALNDLSSFDYFFLFNPDAFSHPGLIQKLLGALTSYPNAACASPRINQMDGSLWYAGATINRSRGKVLNTTRTDAEQTQGRIEVDVFSGCACLFNFAIFKKVGMFNEHLFMYYDEADLSMRIKQSGYCILYLPDLQIAHDVSYTTRYISHLKTYYMTRNKLIVFGNSMTLFSKLYFVLYELAFHLKNFRIKNALYHLRGLLDYKRGRTGAMIGN